MGAAATTEVECYVVPDVLVILSFILLICVCFYCHQLPLLASLDLWSRWLITGPAQCRLSLYDH